MLGDRSEINDLNPTTQESQAMEKNQKEQVYLGLRTHTKIYYCIYVTLLHESQHDMKNYPS